MNIFNFALVLFLFNGLFLDARDHGKNEKPTLYDANRARVWWEKEDQRYNEECPCNSCPCHFPPGVAPYYNQYQNTSPNDNPPNS